MNNIDTLIKDLPNDKILIIVCIDSNERLKIHKYLM